jgi:hypothetical protein
MKGYLQRLVRTATNPVESIHPWEGSIFAAAQQGNFNVVQTEELAPAAPVRQSSEVMSPASVRYSQPSVPNQASPPETGHNLQTSESRSTYIAAGLTQAERGADLKPVNERIIFKPLISYIERSSPDSLAARKPRVTPLEESETALPRRAVAPLLAPQAKTPNARAVRSHVAGDQRTDEIQIHIGRIEVTAIHPPAPSVPKARHKEISLDAYLKRRDGRAR